ncbi:zf-PARP-domain-containing protein [Obba rivulosa]|uniref:Zf-PARP-domain-containing protein n=1 Tax=Obba rivulosa TaxID=1052685 RepID=A0A8E2AS42_9APHY|nr:zf-PARP-domain-containing protein [Obba rivulosa]
MSDAEGGKRGGYRLEYASSNRAKCKGPKPCAGTTIDKGELRLGTLVDIKGNTTFQWRHWGCVTPKIITNMKTIHEEAEELDGFENLTAEDQDKVVKAWEDGHVADEDIPDTARKPEAEANGDDEDEDKPKKKRGSKKKDEEADAGPKKGVFKVEYASQGRAKCKVCGENVGKDFFRLGSEVDFRGHKTFVWHHWGCATPKLIQSIKVSYDEPSEIDGFSELKDGEKEKVQRAWDEGEIPEDDQGVGEAIDTGKKATRAPRKKKDADGEATEKPKRGRAKKAKDEDVDELDDDDEKPAPKKRVRKAPVEKPVKEKKARASKKAAPKYEEESGEDFGDEIAAVGSGVEEEDEEPEPETKKRKRAPKGSTSKPASKRSKPASGRGKKRVEELSEEEDEE